MNNSNEGNFRKKTGSVVRTLVFFWVIREVSVILNGGNAYFLLI